MRKFPVRFVRFAGRPECRKNDYTHAARAFATAEGLLDPFVIAVDTFFARGSGVSWFGRCGQYYTPRDKASHVGICHSVRKPTKGNVMCSVRPIYVSLYFSAWRSSVVQVKFFIFILHFLHFSLLLTFSLNFCLLVLPEHPKPRGLSLESGHKM